MPYFKKKKNKKKIVMLEKNRLENKKKELEIKPTFSIRNFIFGREKK